MPITVVGKRENHLKLYKPPPPAASPRCIFAIRNPGWRLQTAPRNRLRSEIFNTIYITCVRHLTPATFADQLRHNTLPSETFGRLGIIPTKTLSESSPAQDPPISNLKIQSSLIPAIIVFFFFIRCPIR